MRRIIYSSVATAGSAAAEAPAILREARTHNGLDGITGLLCAHGDRFLQVFEGPEDSVALTWARIRADQRHRDLDVLADQDVAAPEFGDWSMAYRDQGHPADMLGERLRVLLAGVSEAVAHRFRGFVAG